MEGECGWECTHMYIQKSPFIRTSMNWEWNSCHRRSNLRLDLVFQNDCLTVHSHTKSHKWIYFFLPNLNAYFYWDVSYSLWSATREATAMGSQHTAVKRAPLAPTRGSPCSAVKTKCRDSWALSPGFLPSYSAPSLQEWGLPVPLGHRPWRWGVQRSSRTPAAPLPPLLHILQGGLWAKQSLTPAFPDVAGTRATLRPQGKSPSLYKTWLGCQSFSASGGRDKNREPSVFPSKVCRVPSCPEGRSQRAATPWVQGWVSWGPTPLWADWPSWTGDHLPPGHSPFKSCRDCLLPQQFLHPGEFCELLENHNF